MIRQTVTKQKGKNGGWLIVTRGDCHIARQCWTLGNARDAKQTAAEERIELCRIMADEVGG